jgi:protein TonB
MKLLGIVLATLMMNVVAASQTVKDPGKRQGEIPYSASKHNEDVVLDSIRPVLSSSGYAGRLYYAGQCAADFPEFVYFPATEVHQPTGSGFRAIESIFRGDSSVTVSKGSNNIVSIRIGQPFTTVLQTRVPMFRSASLEQYNPSFVIDSLLGTPEVTAEMARLRLRVPLSLYDMQVVQPAEGRPHMPSILSNMTADQILDSVAVTFHGIVVYAICPEPSRRKMYTVDFVGVPQGGRLDISPEAAQSHLVTYIHPQYPPSAKDARVQGTVILHVLIGKDGKVMELGVESGPPMLQEAALDAVRQWVYKPYLRDGSPVEVTTRVDVIFTLDQNPQAKPTPSAVR